MVNGSTLEIHLYWAGKETTTIPDRGVYGPLLSAIAITPDYDVRAGSGLSAGVIAGIVTLLSGRILLGVGIGFGNQKCEPLKEVGSANFRAARLVKDETKELFAVKYVKRQSKVY
ncbi:hypothetical protein Hanom_Chr02g00123931 [Helianthus anomalus]